MKQEYEIRFLDINLLDFEKTLRSVGLVPAFDTLFRITIFHSLSGNDREYVRVRDEGNCITVTHKRTFEGSVVAYEREILVDSYEGTIALLEGIGLKHKRTEEKHRKRYKYKDAVIDIDTWPGIPTYIEIETSDESSLIDICNELGFSMSSGFRGDAHDVFRHYGIEPTEIPLMIFSEEEKVKFESNEI